MTIPKPLSNFFARVAPHSSDAARERADFPVARDWAVLVASFFAVLAASSLAAWWLLGVLNNETPSATPTESASFEPLRVDELKAFVEQYDTKRARLLEIEGN